jgi:hypothetical protein
MTETVMVEIENPAELLTQAAGRESGCRFVRVRDQCEFIQQELNRIGFACMVHPSNTPTSNDVLIEVDDPSREIVGLVTDKLNEVGIRCMVYRWDQEAKRICQDDDE